MVLGTQLAVRPSCGRGRCSFFVVCSFVSTAQAAELKADPSGAARLKAEAPPETYRVDSRTGTPRYVSGRLSRPVAESERLQTVLDFFEQNKSLYKMTSPAEELRTKRVDIDRLGMAHVRFNQTYNGLTVIGREMIAHFDQSGVLKTVNGSFEPKINLNVTPAIDRNSAVEIAQTDLGGFFGKGDLKDQAELVVFPGKGKTTSPGDSS